MVFKYQTTLIPPLYLFFRLYNLIIYMRYLFKYLDVLFLLKNKKNNEVDCSDSLTLETPSYSQTILILMVLVNLLYLLIQNCSLFTYIAVFFAFQPIISHYLAKAYRQRYKRRYFLMTRIVKNEYSFRIHYYLYFVAIVVLLLLWMFQFNYLSKCRCYSF
jgi:heme O synthase-like polyprenyltransferase